MNLVTRPTAAAESYPTFWNEDPTVQVAPLIHATEDAYTAFVNLAEDELPDELPTDAVADPD